jgi:predicted alpha/beta-hydrolase family hydrolase
VDAPLARIARNDRERLSLSITRTWPKSAAVPDPLAKLVAAHRQALQHARELHAGPIVLAGKSMGGRVGCHLALEETVAAVVCLGYPLCGGGDPTKRRDAVLRALATPILFVQGTRDSLCPLDLLAEVRKEMRAENALHLVEGGDHSLQVAKKQLKAAGETQELVDERILESIAQFIDRQITSAHSPQ